MATVEPELEIEAHIAGEYVDCQIHTSQLDHIYNLLSPHAKAIAVLTGVDQDIT